MNPVHRDPHPPHLLKIALTCLIVSILLLVVCAKANAGIWENGWCWDQSMEATSYQLCWTSDPSDWWSGQCFTSIPIRDCRSYFNSSEWVSECCYAVPCPPPGRVQFWMAVGCNHLGCDYQNKASGVRRMRWCP